MAKTLAIKLIEAHLVSGNLVIGEEIAIKVAQTLCQDATGTLVMLENEAMHLERTKTEVSVQYVDHNLIQTDFKNADDHLFLASAAKKFGLWYSAPGNGVSHPVHMERFGIPGKTLLGSDSHTCAAGSLGMLAIGAGGMEIAMAMAGYPFTLKMPKIFGVELVGQLPPWVSAKDVILELLRRHKVTGGVGKIIEFYGEGLKTLTAMDRHVISNMGAELGATASIFPSDEITLAYLQSQERAQDWREFKADKNAVYDETDYINLSLLEPLIALPNSPDNVVPVREVAGRPIYQAMIGSSANPGLRDFCVAADIVAGKKIYAGISFDINPSSRQVLENLTQLGFLAKLIHAGARIHQSGCNGCIGMGQAPATDKISLRTVPRNFPGRSGTQDDQVYLCSPETAAASAIMGVITDPRTLEMPYPHFIEPKKLIINTNLLTAPLADGRDIILQKGPNITSLPDLDPFEESLKGPVLIKVGNNISTDTILPAGTEVLPFRSNIQEISKFVFRDLDPSYFTRCLAYQKEGSFIVAGDNYGQGSSREHATLAPRYLGVRAVLAKSFARIHRQNLTNFGILTLIFIVPQDYDLIDADDKLIIENVRALLPYQKEVEVKNLTKKMTFRMENNLSEREITVLLAGGLINTIRKP